MKKKCIRTLAGMLIMAAVTLPGCEFIQDCGTCEEVIDDGTEIRYGEERLVCGDAYLDLLYSAPVEEDGVTIYWSCK